eukprot:1195354-Prorocentrum_minimum.AAC.2
MVGATTYSDSIYRRSLWAVSSTVLSTVPTFGNLGSITDRGARATYAFAIAGRTCAAGSSWSHPTDSSRSYTRISLWPSTWRGHGERKSEAHYHWINPIGFDRWVIRATTCRRAGLDGRRLLEGEVVHGQEPAAGAELRLPPRQQLRPRQAPDVKRQPHAPPLAPRRGGAADAAGRGPPGPPVQLLQLARRPCVPHPSLLSRYSVATQSLLSRFSVATQSLLSLFSVATPTLPHRRAPRRERFRPFVLPAISPLSRMNVTLGRTNSPLGRRNSHAEAALGTRKEKKPHLPPVYHRLFRVKVGH